MTSARQAEANRANSQRSTGPKTPEGKQFSSFNALQHGIYARDVVLPGEDRDAYDALLHQLHDDLAPEGRVEAGLVRRLADIWWRLDRTQGIEAGLLNPDWDAGPQSMNIPLVDTFRIAVDHTPTLDMLGRYEGRLERALDRTMRLFKRAQDIRLRNQRNDGSAS